MEAHNDNKELADARDRVVAAALRFAAGTFGGLDQENSEIETELAERILERAVRAYAGQLDIKAYLAG